MKLSILFLAICTGLAAALIAYLPKTSSAAALKDVRTQQYLGNQFRCGFYYYKTSSSRLYANITLQDIEDDINHMADLGFNYVYAKVDLKEGTTEYPRLDCLLQTCAKRKMAVTILFSGAASLPQALASRHTDQWKSGWSAERLVKNVVPYIKKYKAYPQVVDFAVLEEPDIEALERVHQYYLGILHELPGTPLSLLYNKLDVAVADKPNNYPVAIGHDDYPFKGKPLRTPGFALQYYASQMDAHQQLARFRGQAFEAVFSGFTQQKIDSTQKDAIGKLAEAGNQGYSIDKNGQIHSFFRYRPPKNATTAMCWIAVAKGADSMSVFTWSPSRISTDAKSAYVLGWDNKGSLVLDEYASFARKIRPFGKLMRSVSRDITSFTLPAKAGDIVPIAPKSNPVIQVTDPDVVWDSFSVPGYQGKMVVIVNTKIGTWSDGKSPLVLNNNDPFHIDNEGNLIDFVPFTGIREVHGKVLLPNVEATDLMTGTAIPVDANGNLELDIAPGAGRIVFFAPVGSGEAQALMGEYQLPINTASS